MGHPTIATLEFYSLGRLTEPKVAQVEEHLLVCDECRDRVSSLDFYHAALKEALADKQMPKYMQPKTA